MELARRKPRSHHPTSRVVLGQQARFWPKVHIALTEGQHRDTPLACTMGLTIALTEGQHRDTPLACTMGLTNEQRPGPRTPVWLYRLNWETGETPTQKHTHTHTHTHIPKQTSKELPRREP